MKTIIVATNNKNKAKEIKEILPNYNVLTLADIGFEEEIEENGTTFLENAVIKAMTISKFNDSLVLADDSGLEVDHLNGEPGVYSKRFANSDSERIEKMLRLLDGAQYRKARFKCAVAITKGEEVIADFEGVLEGKIACVPNGNNGFGYDPIFIPENYSDTLATLSSAEKNSISHRGKAFSKAAEFLAKIL